MFGTHIFHRDRGLQTRGKPATRDAPDWVIIHVMTLVPSRAGARPSGLIPTRKRSGFAIIAEIFYARGKIKTHDGDVAQTTLNQLQQVSCRYQYRDRKGKDLLQA